MAQLPTGTSQGPFDVRVADGVCLSAPFPVNYPEIWWGWPTTAVPGSIVRLFGRNLDENALQIDLARVDGRRIFKAAVKRENPYALRVVIPESLSSGVYQLRARLSDGRAIVSASPLEIRIEVLRKPVVEAVSDVAGLYRALRGASPEGRIVRLAAGEYRFAAPLNVPAGVVIEGAGSDVTTLRFGPILSSTQGLAKTYPDFATSFHMPELSVGLGGGAARAAILMLGSNSGLVGLTIDGGGVAEQGAAIVGSKVVPIHSVVLRDVRIHKLAPFALPFGRTQAVLVRHVRGLVVINSDLTGNGAALLLEDVLGGEIVANVLAGGGEGVISGHEGGVRRLIIQGNRFRSHQDGAPQAIRMLWLSTLFGSTYENYVEGNSGANFHPPVNTDQNRGEAILLETSLSHPYYGKPLSATDSSVTLPVSGPDWSILEPNLGIRGTRLSDYFVVVVNGAGQGQVRQLAGRSDNVLRIDRPWRVTPNETSTILLTELNYRNIILNNRIHDAMMGVLLWVNGIDNVISGNQISRIDREGILVYGDAMGGPQRPTPPFWPIVNDNMAGWNRGIGTSYFNVIENNTVSDAEIGISIAAGDFQTLRGPIDWPVSMGNIVRGNTVTATRSDAITVGERFKYGNRKRWIPGFTVVGTAVEDNIISAVPRSMLSDQRTQVLSVVNNQLSGAVVERARQVVDPKAPPDWLVQGNNFNVPRLTWPDAGKDGVPATPAQ